MIIIIPGKPIPKQRARYSKRGKHVITYDPQEADKKDVRYTMIAQMSDYYKVTKKSVSLDLDKIGMAKAFSVQFIFFLPINQSDSVVTRNKKLWGITRASTKPDYDNLEKFYLDCANGILWDDDSKVIQGKALKLYSEQPRTEIVVKHVEDIRVSKNVENVLTQFTPSEFKEFQHYAKEIAAIDQPDMECIEDATLQDWIISTAILLNEFAINFAPKLTKISKLGDLKLEVKNLEEFKAAVKA
jgi:Holliday junction resolvase RusA-like endonuclease